MSSSFEIAQQVGDKFAPRVREARDTRNIDSILSNFAESGDEKGLDNAIQQVLTRVSKPNQQAAMQYLQGKKNNLIQQKQGESFKEIASQIRERYPNNPQYGLIADVYESTLTPELKEKVVKSISDRTPERQAQQKRLNQEHILKHYSRRINELSEEKKNSRSLTEKKEIQSKINDLRKERDSAVDLSYFKDTDEEVIEKVKFDPKDSSHKAVFESIKEQFGNDKVKVNEAMAEIFTT